MPFSPSGKSRLIKHGVQTTARIDRAPNLHSRSGTIASTLPESANTVDLEVVFPIGNFHWKATGGTWALRYVLMRILAQKCGIMDIVAQSPRTIGAFVRTRRQAAKLTQRELAELAGVGTRLVSDLERGKPTLRMDAVNRVLRVFGRMLAHVEAPKGGSD